MIRQEDMAGSMDHNTVIYKVIRLMKTIWQHLVLQITSITSLVIHLLKKKMYLKMLYFIYILRDPGLGGSIIVPEFLRHFLTCSKLEIKSTVGDK